LGGHDPYAASKAPVELVTESYRQAYFATAGSAVAPVQAGNIIGGGDWSADRLLPDAIRDWLAGQPHVVRRPDGVRLWQHVLDLLAGCSLGQSIGKYPGLLMFSNPPERLFDAVKDIRACRAYGKNKPTVGPIQLSCTRTLNSFDARVWQPLLPQNCILNAS
jgi:nucleoside-diphosphate-sugar epimerase